MKTTFGISFFLNSRLFRTYFCINSTLSRSHSSSVSFVLISFWMWSLGVHSDGHRCSIRYRHSFHRWISLQMHFLVQSDSSLSITNAVCSYVECFVVSWSSRRWFRNFDMRSKIVGIDYLILIFSSMRISYVLVNTESTDLIVRRKS